MDADSLPVVIPFVHTGMHDIMPVGKRIPRAGKRVCAPYPHNSPIAVIKYLLKLFYLIF
jgi:monolysocardiolipin acyltransferase